MNVKWWLFRQLCLPKPIGLIGIFEFVSCFISACSHFRSKFRDKFWIYFVFFVLLTLCCKPYFSLFEQLCVFLVNWQLVQADIGVIRIIRVIRVLGRFTPYILLEYLLIRIVYSNFASSFKKYDIYD